MHPWRILLDLDGTVANNAGRRIAAREFGINITEEQYAQSLLELLGLTVQEFWDWWHANQDEIYDQAEPLAGAPEAVTSLKGLGAEIVVVTARRPDSEPVTTRWLRRFGIPFDRAVFGADDKVAVARELGLNIAFEDDSANALALAEIMPVILVDNRRNREQEIAHPQIYRISRWDEVLPLVQTLTERPA